MITIKTEKKQKLKESKGITLIALVITIIVLLILAGVAIVTLTGDNGILSKARDANSQTEQAKADESLKIAIAGSYGLDGKLDVEQLNKNLKNIEEMQEVQISSLPAILTLNGYKICINKNGEIIKLPEGVSDLAFEIAMNPQAYYGKKVTNYKNDGNTYRIFYVDKDNYFGDGEYTIYLKADFSSTTYSNFSNLYNETNTKIRTMNPLWAVQRGNNESNWGKGEIAAAVLCSPVEEDNYATTSLPWNEYYKPNDTDVNYVIGGPSIEMYVKSYNQAYKDKIDYNNKYPIGSIYRNTDTNGYIYTINDKKSTISNSDYSTGTDSIDYQNYNSMYCGKTENGTASKIGEWWLSSPSSAPYGYGVPKACCVNGEAGELSCINVESWCSHSLSISPIVSLKPSFNLQIEE